jgi:hypothetical protein
VSARSNTAHRAVSVAVALLLAGCASGGGSEPTRPTAPAGTNQQQQSDIRRMGYGPCIEDHRDAAGNISVADMEKCVELHLD